jgi:Fe-S-cluster containining protein
VNFVEVDHPRFRKAQRDVFVVRVVSDCMTHECKLRKHDDQTKLDACCQYGVDVDVSERDQILVHKEQIREILDDEVKDLPWFKDEVKLDPDFPTGSFVRTHTHGEGLAQGCLFLHHDGRGCAIHRASVEGGWDFNGVKPNVCRLFPLSYDSDSIVLSDDYADYSCAGDPATPTVYRVARDTISQVFGDDVVAALDQAEAKVLSLTTPLRVVQ